MEAMDDMPSFLDGTSLLTTIARIIAVNAILMMVMIATLMIMMTMMMIGVFWIQWSVCNKGMCK